jgi:hypothetical protein
MGFKPSLTEEDRQKDTEISSFFEKKRTLRSDVPLFLLLLNTKFKNRNCSTTVVIVYGLKTRI